MVQSLKGGGGVGVGLFHDNYLPHPKRLSSAPRVPFFFLNPFWCMILANLAFPLAFKSRVPSRLFAFSRIPLCILVKSRVPKIPFQGKALETSDLMLSLLNVLNSGVQNYTNDSQQFYRCFTRPVKQILTTIAK